MMKSAACEKFHACVEKCGAIGPLLARIVLGLIFASAGWGKLHNLEKVTAFFTELGIPAAGIQAPFVATLEFVGGIFTLFGVATRIVSPLLAFTMFVALITAKRAVLGQGLLQFLELSEVAYLVMFIWLFFAGPGKLSVDQWCKGRCEKMGN